MKRKFTLTKEDGAYVLKDTNPNRKELPFKIEISELKFDTASFYDYVFRGVDKDYEIVVDNRLDSDDKAGSIIYKTIDEIAHGVLARLEQ